MLLEEARKIQEILSTMIADVCFFFFFKKKQVEVLATATFIDEEGQQALITLGRVIKYLKSQLQESTVLPPLVLEPIEPSCFTLIPIPKMKKLAQLLIIGFEELGNSIE